MPSGKKRKKPDTKRKATQQQQQQQGGGDRPSPPPPPPAKAVRVPIPPLTTLKPPPRTSSIATKRPGGPAVSPGGGGTNKKHSANWNAGRAAAIAALAADIGLTAGQVSSVRKRSSADVVDAAAAPASKQQRHNPRSRGVGVDARPSGGGQDARQERARRHAALHAAYLDELAAGEKAHFPLAWSGVPGAKAGAGRVAKLADVMKSARASVRPGEGHRVRRVLGRADRRAAAS